MLDIITRDQLSEPVRRPLYDDEAAMIADQSKQIAGWFYGYEDTRWEYLGTTTETIADYREVGGAGGGLELIAFSTVINMTGNYKSVHAQTGAIAITKGTYADPSTEFENKTVQLIEANGSGGKPTFSSDFVVQMDTWSNNTGDINQLIYKGSPSGKILVWMDNVELA